VSLPDIADLIETNTQTLVKAWTEAVRSDPRIHSDEDLTDEGLINHVPFIIEEICHILRAGETPHAENTREGRTHVYTRYRQGYRARDLVREISLLRLMLLKEIAEFLHSKKMEESLKVYVEAAETINIYIDEELRYGISVYTEADG
jgi:hypothetical protein